jgi:hypothetical protein
MLYFTSLTPASAVTFTSSFVFPINSVLPKSVLPASFPSIYLLYCFGRFIPILGGRVPPSEIVVAVTESA